MKRFLTLLALLAMVLLTACGGKKEEAAPAPEAAAEKPLKVGIVLSIGGLGDKSFNDSAYRGLENAKKDLGIEFKYVEPASPSEDEGYLRIRRSRIRLSYSYRIFNERCNRKSC